MIFNLVYMINEIRTIEEIDFTDKYFFDCFFGTLSIKMNVKKNGNTLNFDPPRVSEVMTGKDNLYEVIAKLAYKPETKGVLLEDIDKMSRVLFGNVSLAKINDTLRKMEFSDSDFQNDIEKEFSKDNRNDKEIFVDFLIQAMKIEYKERKFRREYKIATGNFVTKKADATICSELIEQMIRNVRLKKENIKHETAWSLEDKMDINCFDTCLRERIVDAFDDLETVMTGLDNLAKIEIQAGKILYALYKKAYYDVLIDLLGKDYKDEKIKEKSSEIFLAVNEYMYDHTLKGKIKINEDTARYNLFCITVAAFYQCKFLLKVEGEKK